MSEPGNPGKDPDVEAGAESQPLLARPEPEKPRVSKITGLWNQVRLNLKSIPRKSGVADFVSLFDSSPMTTYDPEELTNWKAVTLISGTVFVQKAVIGVIFMQFATAWAIAGAIIYFIQDPEAYSTDTVSKLLTTLTISISFLLGLFLSACVSRWWDTIKDLERVFGSIKKLVMTVINLELPSESRPVFARRCVLSLLMLNAELQLKKTMGDWGSVDETAHTGDSREVQAQFWEAEFAQLEALKQISREERVLLERVPSYQRWFFAWSLVSKELTQYRNQLCRSTDAAADALGYDRLCGLLQDALANSSSVWTNASFQLPFIYVHLLAFMVHLVNMLTAVGTGITVGILMSKAHAEGKPVDRNALGSAMVFLVVQAFVYQAFLSIGAALSCPITGVAYRVPLHKMITVLDGQLKLLNILADEHEEERLALAPSVASSS